MSEIPSSDSDPTPHEGEPTYGELRELLDRGARLVAAHGDSERFEIVNVRRAGNWMKFVPAGFVPELEPK